MRDGRRWMATIGVAAVLWAGAASAGQPTDQLRGAVDRVIKVLDDPGLKASERAGDRRAALRKIAQEIFDYPELARRALGRHWAGLSEPQREEFTALFGDLLEWSYASKIEMYGGERVAYGSERAEGDLAVVPTRIVARGGTEVPVDYRMLRKGERWLVYDVSVEGVSLVSNYRTQFNSIMQTSSYADLIQRLRTRQDELTADGPAKTKPAAPARR